MYEGILNAVKKFHQSLDVDVVSWVQLIRLGAGIHFFLNFSTDGMVLVAYPDVKPGEHAEEVLADLERLDVGATD